MNILEELPASKSSSNFISSSPQSIQYSNDSKFDTKSIVIIVLVIIFCLIYLGFNVIAKFDFFIKKTIVPFMMQLIDYIGDITGTILIKTADASSDVARFGIDVGEGVTKNVGKIMIGNEAIQKPKNYHINEPEADIPEDSIQKSMTASKAKWCLIGEYQNKRGCIDIKDSEKCMSGQVFPNRQACVNG